MQLLATTYNNIGPFLDRTLTVSFHKGKYLIKAPIGSGKSFMFFDGPVFGLYKYSGRTMLSMKAKDGYIKAFFESGDNYFLVVRGLTRTKSGGDSVKSKLYQVSIPRGIESIIAALTEIISEDTDIEDILRNGGAELEEVVFKNETDLQQNLIDFLPPREVYTSTTFLMQDSENMFEMTPADRINVFKNIFGLLNIDEAKDIISDAKKTTSADLKARRNTDDVNSKLQRWVEDYIQIVSNNQRINDEIISHVGDWELVKDKLGVENFDLASLPLASWQGLAESYDQKRSAYQSLLGQLQALEKQAYQVESEIQKVISQKRTATSDISEIEKKLDTDHTETIKTLQTNRQKTLERQQQITTTLPLKELNLSHVYELNTYISELTQKGKILKQTKELLEQKVEIAEKKIIDIAETKKNLLTQLELVDSNDNKQKFICDLIGDKPCPYVDLINSAYAKNIGQQKDLLTKQLGALDISKAEAEKAKVIQELQVTQSEYTSAIEEYKKYDFKKIKEDIDSYSALENERQDIDKKLLSLEKEKELHEGYKNQLVQLQSSLSHYDASLTSLEKQLLEIRNELNEARNKTDINELDKIELILSTIARAIKLLEAISDLVATHKNNMLLIKQLEERETMLGQLYNVFSKEVMIYVLQQTLPLFADVLNNLLAKVVDYSVSFETNTNSDKIELEIKVHDARGERLVKSLSGGQKTVLRLTWTLAICIFTRSNALFLDETVNNIDRDTIGKVADLIEDFTKTHDITFYIITHSEAIQDMEIWDKVITL